MEGENKTQQEVAEIEQKPPNAPDARQARLPSRGFQEALERAGVLATRPRLRASAGVSVAPEAQVSSERLLPSCWHAADSGRHGLCGEGEAKCLTLLVSSAFHRISTPCTSAHAPHVQRVWDVAAAGQPQSEGSLFFAHLGSPAKGV